MDAETYKKEQQAQKQTLKDILDLIPALCHRLDCAIEAVPVTKPNIGPASWVFKCQRLGANVIQQSAVGCLGWEEYEPNRDRSSIVLHYSAFMNGTNGTLEGGGDPIWEFQVAIYDPEKFWTSVQKHGEAESGFKMYFELLSTLWAGLSKNPIKSKERPMISWVTKIESVNYPKADQ
ncbi:hypothetical protein V8C42DRAFT_356766 [Trichoderma barbatum]